MISSAWIWAKLSTIQSETKMMYDYSDKVIEMLLHLGAKSCRQMLRLDDDICALFLCHRKLPQTQKGPGVGIDEN